MPEMRLGSPGSAPADEVHDPDDMQEPPVQQRLEEQVAITNGSLEIRRLAANSGPGGDR